MSNAIVVPASFQQGAISSVFQGQAAADDMSGGMSGGYGLIKYRGKVWSIQYQGNTQNLMREDGDGPRGSIDVVILKANAALSKTFYPNGWDENSSAPPDCASANGIVPDQGVPHKQADVCALCPKNAWGSAPNGGKGKACGDHRRMAAVPLLDIRNESLGGPLLLRCPAASLQDLAAFDARYKSMGYPYFSMGIKIGFDPAESFPKFTFQAIRPLTDAEALIVKEMQASPLVARVVNEGSAPAQAVPVTSEPAFLVQQPAPAAAAVAAPVAQVQVQPVIAQPAAAPAVAPVDLIVPASGSAGGFGAAAPVASAGSNVAAAQPAAQQPTTAPVAQPAAVQPVAVAQPAQVAPVAQPAPAARPAPVMTGFGPATPEGNGAAPAVAAQAAPAVTQQPVEQVTPQPVVTQPSPGTVTAFEGSIDERLAALIG